MHDHVHVGLIFCSFVPSTKVERSILDKSVDMKDHTAGKTA